MLVATAVVRLLVPARWLQEIEHFLEHLFLGQAISRQVEVTVGAGVTQAVMFLVQVGLVPANAGATPSPGFVQGDIEIDEQVWRVEALPHVGHVGMVLGSRVGVTAQGPQAGHKYAFA